MEGRGRQWLNRKSSSSTRSRYSSTPKSLEKAREFYGDIQALFDHLKGRRVKMLDEGPRKFSTGAWVFLAEDPEGYVVEFVKRTP